MSDHSTHTHTPCGCLLPAPNFGVYSVLDDDLPDHLRHDPATGVVLSASQQELLEAAIGWDIHHRPGYGAFPRSSGADAMRAKFIKAADDRLHAAVAALLGDDE